MSTPEAIALALKTRDWIASEVEAMAANARAAEEPDEAHALERAAIFIRAVEVEGHLKPQSSQDTVQDETAGMRALLEISEKLNAEGHMEDTQRGPK